MQYSDKDVKVMENKMITQGEIEKLEKWSKGHEVELLPVEKEGYTIGLDSFSAEGRLVMLSLKENERKVLLALIENCFTEDPLSNTEIALKAGVDKQDIPIIRCRPRFGEALSCLLKEAMRSWCDVVVGHIFRQSALGRTTASKLYLELIDVYRPISRTMSLTYQVEARDLRGKSAEEMRRMVVEDWRAQGWEKDEFEKLWEGGEGNGSKDSER